MLNNNSSLDVTKYFENNIKEDINNNAAKVFNDAIISSNVNVETNKTISLEIDNELQEIKAAKKKILVRMGKGIAVVILLLLGAALFAGGVFFIIETHIDSYSSSSTNTIPIVLMLLGIIVIIFAIFCKITNKQCNKELAPMIDNSSKKIFEEIKKLSTIADKISKSENYRLLERSYNTLKLNEVFSKNDYSLWENVFPQNKDESIYSEIHGEVHGHPFLYLTTKKIIMIDFVYSDGGKSVTRERPTILLRSTMYYKVNALPELNFNNERSIKTHFGLNHFYRKHKNQREMENLLFDKAFPCIRNNEIAFKTVFSIYTQEQILNTIEKYELKSLKVVKNTTDCIKVQCKNKLTNTVINLNGYGFLTYSLKTMQENYQNKLSHIITYLYQYLSPVLSMSIYQQEKYVAPKFPENSFDQSLGTTVENLIGCSINLKKYLHPDTSSIFTDGNFNLENEGSSKNIFKINLESYKHVVKTKTFPIYDGENVTYVTIIYYEFYQLYNATQMFVWINDKNNNDKVYSCEQDELLSTRGIWDLQKIGNICFAICAPLTIITEGLQKEIKDYVNKTI